ncbi:hypothetical protein P3T36_003335 [Kitasatospora sp. MAP12-15]|uniref:DUF6238 family protein n=1 Tax=unclassified Kitasatospora TaxID=2633591 RepID=UPI00247535BD|nr:DUF6238 family protein [Kitasatospora sp. MAP12-44]MDH6111311.1 hypothetical protein [Kitasatospora sp. MAP12-44]
MQHPHPTAPDLMRFATSAIEVHHHTSVPDDEPASRAELDALHAHVSTLYALLDARTDTTRPVAERAGDHLHAARIRLWQTAEHLHDAYHASARADGRLPTREACALRLPEGAPGLTICQRHMATSARVRHVATPADLRSGFTGLVRH